MAKKKEKTIRQRVEELIGDYKIPEELQPKAAMAIMELIERAKSPDMFCKKCDTRMSVDLEARMLHCFNCGNKKELNMQSDRTTIIAKPAPLSIKPTTEAKPNEKEPDKKLLEAIDRTEKGNEPARTINPKSKGKSIQEIANSRGGGSKVTKEDEDFIKNTIPGAKNSSINWV